MCCLVDIDLIWIVNRSNYINTELVILTSSNTLASGLMLGIITILGFAVTTLASVFIWESRSLKLFLIDIGYPALGIIATAITLSLWQ